MTSSDKSLFIFVSLSRDQLATPGGRSERDAMSEWRELVRTKKNNNKNKNNDDDDDGYHDNNLSSRASQAPVNNTMTDLLLLLSLGCYRQL